MHDKKIVNREMAGKTTKGLGGDSRTDRSDIGEILKKGQMGDM